MDVYRFCAGHLTLRHLSFECERADGPSATLSNDPSKRWNLGLRRPFAMGRIRDEYQPALIETHSLVIASEAKQSRMSQKLDCFAAAKRQFILSACKAVEGLGVTE
jgi:hypothetical protein